MMVSIYKSILKKNMKNSILLGLCLFVFVNGFSQSPEQKIKVLQIENDSLKLVLKKSRLEILNLKLSAFNATESKSNSEKFINKFSKKNYKIAIETIDKTDRLIAYLIDLKEEMTRRSGGLFYAPKTKGDKLGIETENSSKWKKPVGYRDRKIVNLVLIEEGKGEKLKEKIIALHQKYMDIIQSDSLLSDQIRLNVNESQAKKYDKTWVNYNFENMPLAAMYPILAKFRNDAEQSLLVVLRYLKE
jgi:hypothetical protein